MIKVAVLGGGINGVACAVKVKEKFPYFDVVIISEKFSPDTTGDGSGGLWYPVLCEQTSEALVTKWGLETYKLLHQLWLDGGHKVSLVPYFKLRKRPDTYRRPMWADQVFGYQELGPKQLKYFSELYSSEYVAGETFSTFVSRPPAIISYLYKRFHSLQGKVVCGKVSSLSDDILKEYDVVINCTGLGARELVPDPTVFPIRGQIARAKAPWICQVIADEDRENYIIPNAEFCVLGGTHQENDYNTQVSAEDSNTIINGCAQIVPSLKNTEILTEWVGLRPGRQQVRLEAEERGGQLYIHNYGHGGSGLTFFWGCANDVLDILKRELKQRLKNKSKL